MQELRAEVYKSGDKICGVYKINPDGLGEFEVFNVIRKLPVEVGRCFRKGEMALLISSAHGMITNAVLVI